MESHNPLAAPLEDARSALRKLQLSISKLNKDLRWRAAFAPGETSAELTQLRDDGTALRLQAAELQTRLTDAQVLLYQHASQAAIGWNPGHWFSLDRWAAKDRQKAQQQVVWRLAADQARLEEQLVELAKREAALSKHLRRYEAIDVARSTQQIEELNGQLVLHERQVAELEERKTKVDLRLDPLLTELARLEARDAELTSRLGRAEGFSRELDRAANGYARKLVHERCESALGVDRPGPVISEAKRERTRLRRDAEKLRRRIKNEAQAGARDIRGVVVDGNNLCFEDRTFIGLAALVPAVAAIAGAHQVTVVFDPSIKRHFTQDALREALPQARVHVVRSRPAADELILDVSRDPFVVVLSNDGFREFREKAAVAEGRIVRHDILNGRVCVPDLSVDVPLALSG